MAGHLQVDGFAGGQTNPFSGIDACEQPLAELHRDRCGGGHHQQRVHADGHCHLQLLAHGGCLAQVAGTTAHAQPVHGHRVHRLLLKPVDTHVGDTGFGVFGYHQSKRDHAPGITRPGPDQGDVVEINLIATEHLLTAGGCEVAVGLGLDQVPENPCELFGLLHPFGGAGLLQQGQA